MKQRKVSLRILCLSLFFLFMAARIASAIGIVVPPPVADPLVVRVQPSGATFAKAYVLIGETRTYFGNVEGGTSPYQYRWEFSNGGNTAYAAVSDPRYISIDHSYGTAGSHWARLTVQDDDGSVSSATIDLQVIAVASDNLERQKNSAIDRGLRYLYLQEQLSDDGSSWPGSGEPIASTGMALIALENHGHNLQAPDSDIYKKSVQGGVRYLLNHAWPVDLSLQPCIGDPEDNDGDLDNDGLGVLFSEDISWQSGDEMYTDPIAVLAIVNSCDEATAKTTTAVTTEPGRFVNGQTLWDIMVDAKDFIAYAQNDCGLYSGNEGEEGNWYGCANDDWDSSVEIHTSELTADLDAYKWTVGSAEYFSYYDDDSSISLNTEGLNIAYFTASTTNPGDCSATLFSVDWGDGSNIEEFPADLCQENYAYFERGVGQVHNYAGSGTYNICVYFAGTPLGEVTVNIDGEVCPGTFTVDWGDGTPPEGYLGSALDCPWSSQLDDVSHNYAQGGSYLVCVSYEQEPICCIEITVRDICDGNGWRYTRNHDSADNSVSQWPTLALEEARSRWHINVNPGVISQLDAWLAYSQDGSGGFGYDTPWYWYNFPKTGAGVAMLHYCGYTEASSTRMQNALTFLDNNWGSENLGHYYGMYAFFKGMKYLNKDVLGSHHWEIEYNQFLVDHQESGDYWTNDTGWWYDQFFATYTALAILAPAIAGLPPVAEAGGPYGPVNAEQEVLLDGSSSHHQDSGKSIVIYEWDFDAADGLWWDTKPIPDDGEGDTGMSATASYPDVGSDMTYTVTLRVTDNSVPAQMDTDTAQVVVTTGEVPPVAVTNGPWAGLPGIPITFDGSGSYDNNACTTEGNPACLGDTIVTYEWDLDADGLYNEGNGDDGTPVTPGDYRIVEKTFAACISHSASLRVTDSFGQSGISAANLNIVAIVILWGQNYETCFSQRISRFMARWGIKVMFKNCGNATAKNVVMTLRQVPTNYTILKGVANLGVLEADEEKWTECNPSTLSADIELKVNALIRPTGSWRWKAEFDFYGEHYIIDNIPALGPDGCSGGGGGGGGV